MPLNTLSLLDQDAVTFPEMPGLITNGFWCLLGYDTVVENCWVSNLVHNMKQCDSCSGSFIIFTFYMVINVAFNVFIFLILKV